MSTKVVTGKVRFSFAYLSKPRVNEGGQEKFSVTCLLPKSDEKTISAIRASMIEASKSKFTGKPEAFHKAQTSIIHDGDGLRPGGDPFGPECKGCWVFTASSNDRPQVVDESLDPLLEPIKSGDYGRISVNFYGYDVAGNRGVAAGLNNAQLLERGESLSGRADAASDFSDF